MRTPSIRPASGRGSRRGGRRLRRIRARCRTISTPGCRCSNSVRLYARARDLVRTDQREVGGTAARGRARAPRSPPPARAWPGLARRFAAAGGVEASEGMRRRALAPDRTLHHGSLRGSRASPRGDGGGASRDCDGARLARRRVWALASSHAPRTGCRPVSGLTGQSRTPSRPSTTGQWHVGRPAPAYRCGGSRGMARTNDRAAPRSRFTRREGFRGRHLRRPFYRLFRPSPTRGRPSTLCYNLPPNVARPHGIKPAPGHAPCRRKFSSARSAAR
jgi:hypothetical protein